MAIANSGWKKPNPKPTTCEAKATDKHSVVVAFVNFDDVVTSSSSSFPRLRNAQTTCLLPFSVAVLLLFAAKEVKRTDSDDDAKKTIVILLCFVCIYVRLRERNVRRFSEAKSFIFPPQRSLERVAKG